MYYILKAWGHIKSFAVNREKDQPQNAGYNSNEKKNPDKKEVGGWMNQLFPQFFR
jgi:hypothetical protein